MRTPARAPRREAAGAQALGVPLPRTLNQRRATVRKAHQPVKHAA